MSAGNQEARRLVLARVAQRLAKDATQAAARSVAGSSEWRFYRGVETAADHALRPHVGAIRDETSWLQAEEPAFREGFTRGSSLLAGVAATPDPAAVHICLPAPVSRPAAR